MRLQLFIPGLLWPGTQTRAPCEGLALPALELLLAHGNAHLEAGSAEAHALLGLYGVDADCSIAALRRAGEDGLPPATDGHCLCADPVSLQFAREHLLLVDASQFELGTDEARELVDGLNRDFADAGRFELADARRWYLHLNAMPAARFTPLGEVVSRPVAHFMPEGEDQRRWHRFINETQVWLHNHPVNQAREATGQTMVNSLWPWGAGRPPRALVAPAQRLLAGGTLVRGLARLADMEESPAADFAAMTHCDSALACLDACQTPALTMDLAGWRDALASLERDWFAPALAALRRGELSQLSLHAPGDRASLALEVDRGRLWRFWKRGRPLQIYIDRQP